jgi:antitoxin (DNA-binding transcriptional repressor) of toxin-antitoxin stability system
MSRRKTVGIKELKNKLSAYVQDVRRGARVLVSDRGKIVAEIHEPGVPYETELDANPVLAAWARKGIVKLPTRPKRLLGKSPVHLPEGSARRLLDAERRERR